MRREATHKVVPSACAIGSQAETEIVSKGSRDQKPRRRSRLPLSKSHTNVIRHLTPSITNCWEENHGLAGCAWYLRIRARSLRSHQIYVKHCIVGGRTASLLWIFNWRFSGRNYTQLIIRHCWQSLVLAHVRSLNS